MSLFTSRRVASVFATAALAMGVVAPVAANPFDYNPEFVVEQNWMQCEGTTKHAQVNYVVDGDGASTWSTDAPTESVQAGAGCGSVDVGAFGGTGPETIYDPSWKGTFTGNIADMMVELHYINPPGMLYGDVTLDVRLFVDGVEHETAAPIKITPQVSSTGASSSLLFAINDIDLVDDIQGPGTELHNFQLVVNGEFWNSDTAAFVWGTIEVPAGVTFNADTTGLPSFDL